MRPEQLAINSISTRQDRVEDALDAYAEAGFSKVEFHLPPAKELGFDRLRQLLAERGLTSIGGFEVPLACFAAREAREKSMDLLVGNARFLHELGGGIMVFGTDGPADPVSRPLDVVVAAVAELVERTAGLDVGLSLEFNWGPLVRSLQSAVEVISQVGHPSVGVLFDVAHYYTTVTKFEHLLPSTIRWINHVHLDDMAAKPGDQANCNSDRVLPGEGVAGVARIIETLDRAGYGGYYSVEMFNEELWRQPVAEAARRCYTSAHALCTPAAAERI